MEHSSTWGEKCSDIFSHVILRPQTDGILSTPSLPRPERHRLLTVKERKNMIVATASSAAPKQDTQQWCSESWQLTL